ncbi:hypothetical protein M407DRAFT_96428 [Tulasnella calospora MUT 4182]|uniref:Nudix hydrolase domain-containing protein n=1 Tax=Tulasnella calospora MUT 4182 TaxID=1051891 RepID=A0A0C3MGP8_9AGAM|nr:hypothetical protein M407DRAFT_96428 [Tulasnella calospora MUT 4182]
MASGLSASSWSLSVSEFRQKRLTLKDKRLVVGVAVFNTSSRLLLLQRSASEDAYPLMFEIPGGHVEDDDESITQAIGRELKEETGLTLKRIAEEFEGFEYETSKGVTAQLNFVAELEEDDLNVTINPEEHRAIAWVSEAEIDGYPMTDAMRVVVASAFRCQAREGLQVDGKEEP